MLQSIIYMMHLNCGTWMHSISYKLKDEEQIPQFFYGNVRVNWMCCYALILKNVINPLKEDLPLDENNCMAFKYFKLNIRQNQSEISLDQND